MRLVTQALVLVLFLTVSRAIAAPFNVNPLTRSVEALDSEVHDGVILPGDDGFEEGDEDTNEDLPKDDKKETDSEVHDGVILPGDDGFDEGDDEIADSKETPGDDEKPAEETPGEDEKPADETPGDEETPADETPGDEEKPADDDDETLPLPDPPVVDDDKDDETLPLPDPPVVDDKDDETLPLPDPPIGGDDDNDDETLPLPDPPVVDDDDKDDEALPLPDPPIDDDDNEDSEKMPKGDEEDEGLIMTDYDDDYNYSFENADPEDYLFVNEEEAENEKTSKMITIAMLGIGAAVCAAIVLILFFVYKRSQKRTAISQLQEKMYGEGMIDIEVQDEYKAPTFIE